MLMAGGWLNWLSWAWGGPSNRAGTALRSPYVLPLRLVRGFCLVEASQGPREGGMVRPPTWWWRRRRRQRRRAGKYHDGRCAGFTALGVASGRFYLLGPAPGVGRTGGGEEEEERRLARRRFLLRTHAGTLIRLGILPRGPFGRSVCVFRRRNSFSYLSLSLSLTLSSWEQDCWACGRDLQVPVRSGSSFQGLPSLSNIAFFFFFFFFLFLLVLFFSLSLYPEAGNLGYMIGSTRGAGGDRQLLTSGRRSGRRVVWRIACLTVCVFMCVFCRAWRSSRARARRGRPDRVFVRRRLTRPSPHLEAFIFTPTAYVESPRR
ncbi:hypothetical protein LX32DRAFT_278610 [Colletotrichum zoysiae]|uniref:Uncharacterized protein n=1 Tax=Colletotrichum zoysiae TaxID=1216348 RepID=A0AAD9H3B1_9PEZI|nr:hypothetical protein LX32DRAFT_278610 [Colletotrichum zoysiae]